MSVAVVQLTDKAKKALLSLSSDWSNPVHVSRQSVAALWRFHPELVDREWQDGCAQCVYYRLTEAGVNLRGVLQQGGSDE